MLARDAIKAANEKGRAEARKEAEAREAQLLALLEQHDIEVQPPNGTDRS